MTREAPLILSASCAGPDLLVPPHAFKGAFDVCVGAETPDPEWQEHLVAHLPTNCATRGTNQ